MLKTPEWTMRDTSHKGQTHRRLTYHWWTPHWSLTEVLKEKPYMVNVRGRSNGRSYCSDTDTPESFCLTLFGQTVRTRSHKQTDT